MERWTPPPKLAVPIDLKGGLYCSCDMCSKVVVAAGSVAKGLLWQVS